MDIRPLSHTDIRSIPALLPLGWEDSLSIIEAYTTEAHCCPIKASIGIGMVGIGTAIIHGDTAWLAHIIVHPAHRNRGIGKTITKALVETAYSKGCETIYLLATEPGEPVYRRVGFVVETEYPVFTCGGVNGPSEDSGHIVPLTDAFRQQVLHLDRQATGEDRLPELGPHLSNGLIYLHDNEVKGFYLPTLGHGPIKATTPAAGQEMMGLRLRSMDTALFPMGNPDAMTFMRQHGFAESRREKHMRLGKERTWHPGHIYGMVGGNLG